MRTTLADGWTSDIAERHEWHFHDSYGAGPCPVNIKRVREVFWLSFDGHNFPFTRLEDAKRFAELFHEFMTSDDVRELLR